MNDVIGRYLPKVASQIESGGPVSEFIEDMGLMEIVHRECLRRGVFVEWCCCGEFLLKTTLVTQGEWASLMGNNPSHFRACGDNAPVEQVSWYDALAYCNALSRKDGLPECYDLRGANGTPGTGDYRVPHTAHSLDSGGYRLPSGTEWRSAYVGGKEFLGHNLDAVAWYIGNSEEHTHHVAGKEADEWGLYDMLGNVWEWSGNKDVELYGVLVLGGSWSTPVRQLLPLGQQYRQVRTRYNDQGFRVARTCGSSKRYS